jgi:UDP-2-acetamido-2,6-beta-L-arabino-hexul-4-ose reductase
MNTILVTGSAGFVGKNLVEALRRLSDVTVLQFDNAQKEEDLYAHLQVADVVYHLAGVNRPEREEEFVEGNANLTSRIVASLLQRKDKPTVVFSSSTQAELDNAYGRSKREAERALEAYGAAGGSAVIFRLTNVFGKWSRPDYNSAVATFCHNTASGLKISVSDPARILELVYIDDVVSAFLDVLSEPNAVGTRYRAAGPTKQITLEELVNEIVRMRDIRTQPLIPDMSDRFRRALYATFLSFLPEDSFDYQLDLREDNRGTLAELLKSPHFGQLFVSRTKPGAIRGNHFHRTKVEKFCVLEGEAVISFRQILGKGILSYPVTGNEFRVVDIPPGYTHSIENVGTRDLIVLFWASEVFDPMMPDTYPLSVSEKQ